jgi:hypothetical protein
LAAPVSSSKLLAAQLVPVAPRPLSAWRWLWLVPLAAALGVGFGLLVSHDREFSPHHPLWGTLPTLLGHAGWWWTPTALTGFLLLLVAIRWTGWVFEHRFAIAVLALLASTTMTGINIAARDAFELALLLALAVWVVTTLAEHRPIRTPRFPLALLLGMSVCVFASVVNGRGTSLLGLHTYLVKFMAAFLLVELIIDRRLHRAALAAIVYLSVFAAVVALVSQLLFVATGFQLSFDDEPTSRIKNTPLGPLLRTTALLPTAQSLGHLLTMGLGVALCCPGSLLRRLVLGAIIFVGAAGSLSTGTIASTGLVLGLWPFVQWPSLTIHFLAGLLVVGIGVQLSGLLDRFWSGVLVIAEWGLNERVELITGGFAIMAQYPLCGIGVRNATRVLHLPVHNTFVQIGSEAGIVAAVLLTVLTIYTLVGCLAVTLRERDPDTRAWLKGLTLGMFGMSVHCLAEPLANDYLTYAFFGVALSAIALYRPQPHPHGAPHG